MAEKTCLKVCETCPWLIKNHGKQHPGGWYKLANIKRLWNGLRKGDAPGIVCHASDANQVDYGGTAKIKPSVEKRQCAGAVLMIGKHMDELNKLPKYQEYAARHTHPITKSGLRLIVERILFGQMPQVEDRRDEIGLPWQEEKVAEEVA